MSDCWPGQSLMDHCVCFQTAGPEETDGGEPGRWGQRGLHRLCSNQDHPGEAERAGGENSGQLQGKAKTVTRT